MQRCYGGVIAAGSNLPVELEGYNLLLLEKYESTHVRFLDGDNRAFTVSTPHYEYRTPKVRGSFIPAIALPAAQAAIVDICLNPDYEVELAELEVEPEDYVGIRHWNDLPELTFQILLLNGVIQLGAGETEINRYPAEVRKARAVADRIATLRTPTHPASIPPPR